jgi:uncharacterized protein DUF3800
MSLAKVPYDGFRHLCLSLSISENRLLAMFTVYCDESGTHADSGATVVACYVGHAKQWQAFGREWRVLLDSEEIKILHRTDLENFRGEFKGWTDERRIDFLRRAHQIIRTRTVCGFAYAVAKRDFERVMDRQIDKALGGIYGWCVQDCMVAVAQWAKRTGKSDPINYVLEDVDDIEGVCGLFSFVTKHSEYREQYLVGTWSFASKKCVIQLQAADLLAYEVYKDAVNNVVNNRRILRKSARDLIRACDRINFWDEAKLRAYLDRLIMKKFLGQTA